MMDPRTASVPSSDLGSDVTVLPTDAPSAVETVAASAAPGFDVGLDQTLAADPSTTLESPGLEGTLVGRTTVLPKVVTEDAGLLRLETHTRSRYTPQRRLGAGAMGEVELSDDHDIGRPVALKRLSAGHESPTAVARFVDEVRTMGLLDHPNITPIYDVGRDDDGRLFFTMKYVEGESLESLIERLAAGDSAAHAQYPLERRLDVFVGILHALDYAHAQGILHRDIKPANVLLAADKSMLIDFGLAYSTGDGWTERSPDITQEGSAPGTLLYMSPEQIGHAKPAPSMDTYSFGVMLYELFTGNPPYHRLSQAEMIARKCDASQAPYSLAKICPELDEGLATLVHRCLRYAPDDRPTAAELREGLEGVLGARAVAALPQVASSPVAPSLGSPSRSWAPLGALVLGVVGVVGLLWVVWSWSRGPGEPVSTAIMSDAPPMASHMTKQSTEPPAVGAPASKRPRQPAVPVPEPVEAKVEASHLPTEVEDPPTKPAAKQRSEDPCPDRAQAAQRAKSESRWGTVLRLTKQGQCWRGASKTERKKLRTQALLETGKYAECAAAGRGLTEPDAVRWVHICESKSENEVLR